MLSKKLMNDPSRCVQDMLAGLKVAYPALAVNPELGLSFLSMVGKYYIYLSNSYSFLSRKRQM